MTKENENLKNKLRVDNKAISPSSQIIQPMYLKTKNYNLRNSNNGRKNNFPEDTKKEENDHIATTSKKRRLLPSDAKQTKVKKRRQNK